MTPRAIVGLVALNVFVLGVGAAVLLGLRGWRSWSELLRLAGLAYLVGVASLFVVLTVELVVGVPVTATTIVVTGVALSAAGIASSWRRGTEVLARRGGTRSPPRLSLLGAVFAAAILVYLEAAFRAGRLERLWEWDAWRVWTIRAKDIYFSGALDPELVTGDYPSYPPGFAALQASAFHAMGSADVVTVHLLPWFLLVGFVAALAGLLGPRVRQEILLPLLLLLLLAPSVTDRLVWMLADLPLDYLLAVAALLLVLWVDERRGWQLAAATVLVAGSLLTKREGVVLAACVFIAAFAASWSDRRWAWPRLAASVLAALALVLPWRIWILVNAIPDAPQSGYTGFVSDTGRAWPSLKLVLRTFFDYDLWLLVPVLAVGGIVLALLARAWRPAVFAATFLGSALAASAWAMWASPGFTFTQAPGGSPVVRLVGGTVLVLGALTPLLLERAWTRHQEAWAGAPPSAASSSGTLRRVAPWAIVLAAVLAYPGSIAVGFSGLTLPGGAPTFPSASDCVEPPAQGDEVRLVFGYADSYPDALALRDRALAAGSSKVEVGHDGCGRLRVFVDGIPSIEAGRRAASRARAQQLDVWLEASSGS